MMMVMSMHQHHQHHGFDLPDPFHKIPSSVDVANVEFKRGVDGFTLGWPR